MVSRAKDTHTTNRVIRIDDEDWAAYEDACRHKGLTRSADLRMHIKREIAAYRRKIREEAQEWESADAAPPDAGYDAEIEHEDGSRTVIEAKAYEQPKRKRVVRRPKGPASDD